MNQTLRLGRIGGVPVGVNWSVLVIFGLLAWELAALEFPARYGGGSHPTYWVAALVAAVLFFVSLLAHELAHAVVARHNGIGVRSITLWLFGGVAQLEGDALDPGADFRIAAVGPATSLVLAGVFAATEAIGAAAGVHGLALGVPAWLAWINLLLAVFNVIPAAPLDGGRILRAGLWHWNHDRDRAAILAARVGRVFGFILVAIGVSLFFVPGAGVAGLWPAALGWFLTSAARAEERWAQERHDVRTVSVGQAMAPPAPEVRDDVTVAHLLAHDAPWFRIETIPVVDGAGVLTGLLEVGRLARLPAPEHVTTTVGSLAHPVGTLLVARPEDPLDQTLERMALSDGLPVLVLAPDGRLVGVLTLGDVDRAAERAHHAEAG
jgi:Zn-dependent protease/CBS domain-containing protein